MAFPLVPLVIFIVLILGFILLRKKMIAIVVDMFIATCIYGAAIFFTIFFFGAIIPVRYYEIGYPIVLGFVIILDMLGSLGSLFKPKVSSGLSQPSGFRL